MATSEKRRVRILESIAGLADPKPKADLDAKYERMRIANKNLDKPLSDKTMEIRVAEMKLRDRYGESANGFPRDWSFKPNDEPLINAELADKWEASGICAAIAEKKSAA